MGGGEGIDLALCTTAVAALGKAARAIGGADFYRLLLEAFGRCLPHDLSALMRYSPYSQPEILFSSGYDAEFAASYARHFYRCDPFYRYWRDVERPGVVSLRQVVTTAADRSRYIDAVLADVGVTDEIGLFLPPVGRSSLALFLDRRGDRYSDRDVAAATAVFELIAGLHGAHLNSLVGGAEHGGDGGMLAGRRPIRILDRGHNEVVRNRAWTEFTEAHPDLLAHALATLATGQTVDIGPTLILHRAALPPSFHLAPFGSIDTIEPLGLAPLAPRRLALSTRIANALSRRERDIVELMLQGFPIKRIAGHLGLTQGTIKNYRRRIYDKLDITTEREIFLGFIAEMRET